MSPLEQEIKDEDIKVFLEAIKARSNYDFTNYSLKSLKRRIAKILTESKFNINQLEEEILQNQLFMEKVVKSITVNTTELFRDPPIWINIKEEILPKFANHETINIWHAGCSTGQEVYSMMIILDELNLLDKSNLYASDINSDVMEVARAGKYKFRFNQAYIENYNMVMAVNQEITSDKKPTPFSKYFSIDKVSDSIQMNSFLTEKPIYQKIDLVKDENLFDIKFDIVICRNVIIYFNYDLQNKVFNLFYKNLVSEGCLILGVHESILGPYSSQFEKRNHSYVKKDIY